MINSVHLQRLYLRVFQALKFAVPIWICVYLIMYGFERGWIFFEYLAILALPGTLLAGLFAASSGNIHQVDSLAINIGCALFYFIVIFIYVCNAKRFTIKIEEQLRK